MLKPLPSGAAAFGRAPYGARGLKYGQHQTGAAKAARRAPYGARGLKLPGLRRTHGRPESRAPYGARGLKSILLLIIWFPLAVAPRMGRVD